jgi:MOSC domain-containing protein YiiM
MASIYSIVYLPEDRSYGETKEAYIRVPLQQATLVVGHGIQGDRKGGHPDRQLNVISLEWLESLRPRGYKTSPGQFGEQIIVEGLAVEDLPPGARLQMGPEASIEVINTRTGCSRLEGAQGQPVMTAGVGRLGVMARVISGGEIKVGDPVTLLEILERE